MGSSPAKILYCSIASWSLYNCHWKFLDIETLQQTFNGFYCQVLEKNNKFGYLNPILGKLGVTRPWLMAYWKAHFRRFVCVNWNFFTLYYCSPVMKQNVYSSAVFTGCQPHCTKILPEHGRPAATIFGLRKLETLGYPMVKTASLCIPSFWQCQSVMDIVLKSRLKTHLFHLAHNNGQ